MAVKLDVQRIRSQMESQGLSQKDLVAKSGVSRAQLSRILSRNRGNVREQTVARLAQALGTDLAELVVEGRQQQYLDWITEEQGFVDFRGIGMPQFQKQPINDIFVEPDVVSPEISDDCDRVVGAVQWRRSRVPPRPASEAILKQDRIVVLGHPGNGKTTLLRWLACRAALREFREVDIPIYLRLPELSRALEIDPNADPVKFIGSMAADRGCPSVESVLRDQLSDKNRNCLVLFDGLDEVGDESHRDEIAVAVRGIVEQYPRNQFVVTSRLVGFDPAPWTGLGFSVVQLLGYRSAQLQEFVKKWARILPKVFNRPEEEIRDSLRGAISSNSRVRTLASNPLVLTILAILNESRGGMPRRRVDLYAKVVEVFLDTWERTKRSSESFDETSDIDLDAREFGWLLSDLALAVQKNGRTLAARWWIGERIQDFLQGKLGFTLEQAKDAGDRVLRYLTERAGLIEERGLDQFGFSHRTLQEYFAAMGVIDDADSSTSRDVGDSLRGYFYNPQWSEVVRLVAARLTPPAAESTITSILEDPDPVGRFLRRGPLLALRCLSDGTTVANRRLVSALFDSFTDLGQSRWLGITLETFDVLETFEGTRWQSLAKGTVDNILETAKRELNDDEYACLYDRVHWRSIAENLEEQLSSGVQSQAAVEVMADIKGRSASIAIINAALRIEDPERWFKSVCSLVQDESQSADFKKVLVRELGRQITTDPAARRALRKILQESAMSPSLRAACANALAMGDPTSDSRLLLRILEREDDDIEVRAACAASLANFAREDEPTRQKLLQILESDGATAFRVGAARGLEKSASEHAEILDLLLNLANQDGIDDDLRSACMWSLEDQLGHTTKVVEAFKAWLDSPARAKLRHIAAQALGNAMAEDERLWDHHAVEKIEHVLMNLSDPCPHALGSLGALATAREVRRGLRLENVMREALQPFANRIELAFVFGSTARKRQAEDSDIDLLVIGSVTLMDLSTPLRTAERTLGRRIGPAIYTRDSFQQKYQSGDPFLADVYRREKIAVMPPSASRRELEDELTAMVAERLASTG